MIDPARYRNGTPQWVVKLVRFFIPQPQLWIVLDAPTDVIQARKAEVSYEETERQRRAYIMYAENKAHCLLVDTNRDVKDISRIFVNLCVKHCMKEQLNVIRNEDIVECICL